MIVILNNGTKIRIDMEGAQAIATNLMSQDAKRWQCQLNTGQKSIVHIFNLTEVSAVVSEKDVVGVSESLTLLEAFRDTLDFGETPDFNHWYERIRHFILLSQKK